MWIRETENGIEVDVAGAMEEIEAKRGQSIRRMKKLSEPEPVFNVQEDTDDLVLKVGSLFFKLVSVKESSNLESLLREDYDKQLFEEKHRLAAEYQASVDEFKAYADNKLQNFEHEVKEMRRMVLNAAPMPEISYGHAKAGLSVVKGEEGRIHWLYLTVYKPQYISSLRYGVLSLTPAIQKRMVTPIIIMVTTKADAVTAVETKTLSMDNFRHYHRSGSERQQPRQTSDCWGAWKYAGRVCKTPDEVLSLAKEASNVLNTINKDSLASRWPKGLPKFQTLESNVVETSIHIDQPVLNPSQTRTGITEVSTRTGGWTTNAGRNG